MIEYVGTVSVYVSDQQRAKDFYVNKRGMELRTDAELYPGAPSRWIAVAPKGAKTEIILYLPDENWEHYKAVVGKSQSITLSTSDVQATYDELMAKGVEFVSAPETQPWGTFATLKDSEGNQILLVQTA
jgi:lactoylglutathione lyase